MANKREVSALSSELGGYWGGQDSAAAKKAPKKSNASGKKTTNHNPKPSDQTYVIKEKTHAEADFYGGDTVRVFLPKTELGDVIDKHLYWKFAEAEEFNNVDYCRGCEDEIEHILETGGEGAIAPFCEPLNVSFMESLSFFHGRGTFGTMMKPGFKNSKGSVMSSGMR